MEAVTVWVASATAVLSILLALSVTLAWRASTRRAAIQIAELGEALAAVRRTAGFAAGATPVVAEFLITDVGSTPTNPAAEVSSRLVLSATVGEPLVRMASFVYGVRRALTAENRNRIRFEMRREIRRSRKARRAAQRTASRTAATETRERMAS